ncbi:MAG: ABC transporter substrate-binding protein [Bacteroidales bacterium]
MSNKQFIFLLMILLHTVVGCNSPSVRTNNSEVLTIATLKGPSSMGMIKLIDSLSQESEQEFSVKILNEPIQVRKMVIDGSADFAILPTTMASIMYNKGINYKLAAIPVWGTLYLFGSDTTITEWEHLKGKKVNLMAKGMTPDVLFRYLLSANGINPNNDLTLDYSFPTHIDLANAVAAGQADLGVISEPMVSLVMQRNRSVHPIFDLNKEWEKQLSMPIAQTALIIKNETIKNYPERVTEMLKSYKASTKWVNQFPDTAAKLVVKHGILPNFDVAYHAIPRSNLKFAKAKDIRGEIEAYLNIFYQMNPDIIGGKIPDENFYH